MIKLRIDNIEIEVPKGTTILKAAEQAHIDIPSMCFGDGSFTNHPSCMVCVVKEKSTGKLLPSCAYPVFEGMEIITEDDEIRESRKETLELLLSDHVGDCEAPCRIACSANMDIPLMNRLIAKGKFEEAIEVIKKDIALPFILGYICSAPCEKVCRRKDIDQAISICLLKRIAARTDSEKQQSFTPKKQAPTHNKIAIIGAGISGLAAAYHSALNGHEVVVFEKEKKLGGSLNNLSEEILPQKVLNAEIDIFKGLGIKFITQSIDKNSLNILKQEYEAIILASGSNTASNFDLKAADRGISIDKDSYQTSSKKIFACGSATQPIKMAIRALAQGKEVAFAVNEFVLDRIPKKIAKPFNSKFGKLLTSETNEYLKEATKEGRIEPKKGHLGGFSESEAIEEAKRCMHCDCRKLENCKLRDCATKYEVNQKKYQYGDRKEIKKIEHHNSIIYEPEKCIKCGLCIEITKKHNEDIGLTYIGRGFDVKIDIPFNEKLETALTKASSECVQYCPTGAIAYKNDN